MPELVLNRNFVMNTDRGHSVRFEKGKPCWVPPAVYDLAIAIGAQHPDGEAPEIIKDPAVKVIPRTAEERNPLITLAIQRVVARNDRADFTAASHPSVKAIERETGFDVGSHEIAACWKAINELAAAAK